MQNVHYIILVFGWVGGGMGGILYHFHVLLLLIFLY